MRTAVLAVLFASWLVLTGTAACGQDAAADYKNTTLSPRQRAEDALSRMTLEEKIALLGGVDSYFAMGVERLGLGRIKYSDSTLGVHLRDIDPEGLRTTAFPCGLSIVAAWDPQLAYEYAQDVGEECHVVGTGVLLGPGMNIYRVSTCGRNFEYMGEDPYLAARTVERFVQGVQSTGIVATLKHFVANNSDFNRRMSNSRVSERALHEIYLPAFAAGVDAGAGAVMTSYNLVNGEWAGQSRYVITDLLRQELGFDGLVMTDWWSVWDAHKVLTSGQDLEMPAGDNTGQAAELIAQGKITEADVDRMARHILLTGFRFGLYDRPVQDSSYEQYYPEHEAIALRTAQQGTVLLTNNGILPVDLAEAGDVLLVGSAAGRRTWRATTRSRWPMRSRRNWAIG